MAAQKHNAARQGTGHTTPFGVFAAYLSENRLKVTPQRKLILDTFLKEPGHVSAEELYDTVKRHDPSIGQATVYRTLKLFAGCGLAEVVSFTDGIARYELNFEAEHHDHLICEGCGRTIEIMDPIIEKRQEELAAKYGFVLARHRMDLYGLCPDCRKD